MLLAAFPMEDIDIYIDALVNPQQDNSPKYPEDTKEIVKGFMRKYFPWRIDGDTIKVGLEKA